MKMMLSKIKERFHKLEGKKETLNTLLEKNKKKVAAFQKKKIAIEKAQAIIQEVAKSTQENLKFHIEDIVQMGLDICFDDIKFVLDFELKRGRTEANIYFEVNDEKINPMDAFGGGVLDIVSFSLRVACWSLSNKDNTLILDEPIKNLDAENMPKAIELLKQLSEKLGIQFIVITHNDLISEAANTVYKVIKKDSVSTVKRIK